MLGIGSIGNTLNSYAFILKRKEQRTHWELSENEKKEIEELKRIDQEAPRHEQAHIMALGEYVIFEPRYGDITKNQYKVEGEVPPDVEDAIVRYKKANPDIDLQGLQNLVYNQKGVRLDKKEIEDVLRKHRLLDDDIERAGNQQNDKNAFKIGREECSACEERKYQCSDGTVSYMSSSESLILVPRHEMEHVAEARAKAIREGKEVVYTNIEIEYAICPECGERYAAGGKATVKTRPRQEYKQEEVEVRLQGKRTEERDRKEPVNSLPERTDLTPPQEPVNSVKEGKESSKDSPLDKDFINPYAGRYNSLDTSRIYPIINILI